MLKNKTLKFRLSSELKERLSMAATTENTTVTEIIHKAIEQYLNVPTKQVNVPTLINETVPTNGTKKGIVPTKKPKAVPTTIENVPTDKPKTIAEALRLKRAKNKA